MSTPDQPAGRGGQNRPPRSGGAPGGRDGARPSGRPPARDGGARPAAGRPTSRDGAARPPSRDSSARPSSRDNRTRTGDGPEREWVYDPRREARLQLARVPLPDDVDGRELDHDVRKELRPLAKDTAELVARHLVMAGRLIDDDPQQSLAHARAARALAGRVAPAREANGLVAYAAGEWAEALSELRTARRLTGNPEHLAVMADCERALGRPDRALVMSNDPQAAALSPAAKVELLIVGSGARRDLGQPDAAVVALQVAALEGPIKPWTVRLRYAYADALLEAGREQEARRWFALALEADTEGQTDAEERLLELDGVVFTDLQEGDDEASAAEPDHEGPTNP